MFTALVAVDAFFTCKLKTENEIILNGSVNINPHSFISFFLNVLIESGNAIKAELTDKHVDSFESKKINDIIELLILNNKIENYTVSASSVRKVRDKARNILKVKNKEK